MFVEFLVEEDGGAVEKDMAEDVEEAGLEVDGGVTCAILSRFVYTFSFLGKFIVGEDVMEGVDGESMEEDGGSLISRFVCTLSFLGGFIVGEDAEVEDAEVVEEGVEEREETVEEGDLYVEGRGFGGGTGLEGGEGGAACIYLSTTLAYPLA